MNKLKPILSARKDCTISYTIVILAFILIQTMIATGNITSSLKGQLVPICAYIIMAISLNLTVGILGELSLGHAGFMSVGAFTGIVVSTSLAAAIPNGPLRLAISMIVGGLFAGIAGLIVGIPVLRLKGDYLAIVTLAFGEIIKNIINVLYIGLDEKGLHFSLPGRAIMAVRDNKIAAESIGLSVTRYKLLAFVISAVFAGMAGTLYAMNFSTVTASKFDFNTSILILVFVVLGGLGNIWGSIIAAALLTVLPELLRSMNDYRMLIYAILLIVMMIFNNSGAKKRLTEYFSAQKEKRTAKKAAGKGVN